MRRGWTCKGAASVLGICPEKVTQALDPALRKVAKLLTANWRLTIESLLEAADDEQAERERSAASEAEIEYLGRRQTGRLNLTQHQRLLVKGQT